MNLELMMLQVLDDPESVRIIVETKYPNIATENFDNVYFMIDRSDANDVYDAETKEKIQSTEVYDYWQVTDSIGQTKNFNSNVDLIEFLDSIKDITTRAWVESF